MDAGNEFHTSDFGYIGSIYLNTKSSYLKSTEWYMKNHLFGEVMDISVSLEMPVANDL